MNVLVGCERSATVRDEFLKRGHDAYSCDLYPRLGDDRHMQCDAFEAISSRRWDRIILHPPCTCIALCGNKHYGQGMPKHGDRIKAIEWTRRLWDYAVSKCDGVGMENPKNVMGPVIGKRTQAIQPWQFGHPEQKETWLWLHGLPELTPTNVVFDEMMQRPKRDRERIFHMTPSKDRGDKRSKTYAGIAKAMAEQWGRDREE